MRKYHSEEKPSFHIVKGNTQTEKLNNLLNESVVDEATGEVIEPTKPAFVEGRAMIFQPVMSSSKKFNICSIRKSSVKNESRKLLAYTK